MCHSAGEQRRTDHSLEDVSLILKIQSGYQIGWNSVVFLGGFRHLDLGAAYGALAPSLDRATMQERNNGNRESEHALADADELSQLRFSDRT